MIKDGEDTARIESGLNMNKNLKYELVFPGGIVNIGLLGTTL